MSRLALAHDVLIPLRKAVHAAPRDLLLRGDVAGHVVGDDDSILPLTEIEAGYQFGFECAPLRERARRHAEVVIGDATHQPKSNPPVGEELEDRGRAIDERSQPLLVMLAAAEISHVAEDVIAAVLQACLTLEVILPDPDQTIRIGSAAAEQVGLLQQKRFEASLMRGQRRGQARNPGPQYNDVIGFHRAHVLSSPWFRTATDA
jgi:hypothetical protein